MTLCPFHEQTIQPTEIAINQNLIASGLISYAINSDFGKTVVLYDMAYGFKKPFSVSFNPILYNVTKW